MYLYAPGVTCCLQPFTYALNVGYHNGDVLVVVAVECVSGCRIVVMVGILVLFPIECVLYVLRPQGELTCLECLFDVF